MRFRLTVDEADRTVARNFDTDAITARQRRLVEPVADKLVADVVAVTGWTAGDARAWIAAEILLDWADEEAYARVAAKRGVLAL